jgi:fibronectin type 3 domain-containing protein
MVAMLATVSFVAQAFQHPGIGLTLADLNYVKTNLNNVPWNSGYSALVSDGRSSTNYTMQGPATYVNRNNAGNYDNENQWKNDMTAVYNLARMWYFTGDANYAQKSHDILIAWANTQTNYGGIEAPFDLGDYAYRYAGGADILRGTWPGWTAADTATVSNYFNNVFWVDLGLPGPSATGSQGMESLTAAIAIAVFNDDTNKFNQVMTNFLTDADTALRDTLANGEMGDTGRDPGHAGLYLDLMAWMAEVFWKQGVDVYSVYDNRIHACAEYNCRFNLGQTNLPFAPFGAPFWGVFNQIGGSPWNGLYGTTRNIIHVAYAERLGIQTPYIDLFGLSWGMDDFMFYRLTDPSTATPPVIASLPATASLTTGLTSADLNGNTPGSTSYSGGIWTLQGGYNGGDPWNGGSDTIRFAYKQLTGDFTFVAKVNSVSNVGAGNAKAGIMLRDSLGNPGERVFASMTPNNTCERIMYGWTSGGLPYGNNAAAESFSYLQIPYWVKMERVGQRIQTYTSINGGDWSPAGTADYGNLPSTVYVGLFDTSMVSGTLNTATFSNVRITGGDDGAPLQTPPAPFAVYASPGNGQVPLHWNESFMATSYNVLRATTNGGPYSPLVTVTNTSYVDASVTPNTTYYYVVTASNAAGTSGNSIQDNTTTQAPILTGALIGTAGSYNNGGNTIANVFDGSLGSYFDGPDASGDWAGLDLGSGAAATVTQINYCPRSGYAGRMVGGQFQGCNVADFSSGVVTLFTVSSTPTEGVLTAQTISTTNTFRYLRYIGPANGWCNVAEVQFLSIGSPAPSAPTGLAATAGNAQVALTWNTSSGATSYNVKRATVNGGPYTTVANVGTANYTDTSVANGTTYYYVVSALNSGGESANSSQASATPQASAPAAPTGLAATAGNAQVGLTWNASSGATSYNVKRATVNGGPYTTVANVGTANYTDTSVVNGTTYYYVVSALNSGGESADSSQASATPQASAPAAPTGLAATGGDTQVGLTWNASSGATSYNVKRATVKGGPYSTIANTGSTSYTDTSVVNGTTYYYVVSALNAGGESANSSQASATPQAPASLPSPWATADIGAVGAVGSASYNNGTFTVTGSGADIWGTADEFRYVYQTSSGNCTIVARVSSLQNTHPSAKAGVMIRETLAANSRQAMVDITPGVGIEFLSRTTTGGSTGGTSVSGLTAPYWLKLTRSNKTFTASYSTDGTSWTTIGSQNITMSTSAYIGLIVNSHVDGTLCTATFTNVTATP